MKDKDLHRLFKERLQAQLPEFGIARNFIYVKPLGDVLRAVCFETSGFSKNLVDIKAFIQPLFTPESGYAMLITEDIGYFDLGKEGEDAVASKILSVVRKKGMRLLRKCGGAPADFIALCKRSKETHELEALAYAFALTRQWSDAVSTMEKLLPQLRADDMVRTKIIQQTDPAYNPDDSHYVGWIERVEEMKALMQSHPDEAKRLIEGYKTDALRNLRLRESG